MLTQCRPLNRRCWHAVPPRLSHQSLIFYGGCIGTTWSQGGCASADQRTHPAGDRLETIRPSVDSTQPAWRCDGSAAALVRCVGSPFQLDVIRPLVPPLVVAGLAADPRRGPPRRAIWSASDAHDLLRLARKDLLARLPHSPALPAHRPRPAAGPVLHEALQPGRLPRPRRAPPGPAPATPGRRLASLPGGTRSAHRRRPAWPVRYRPNRARSANLTPTDR